MGLLKHNDTFLFLSPEANIFFKKYLNDNKNLLSKAHAIYGTDNIEKLIEKLEPRILVIDKLFNQINPVSIYSFREVFDRGTKLLENGDKRLDGITARIKEDDLAVSYTHLDVYKRQIIIIYYIIYTWEIYLTIY